MNESQMVETESGWWVRWYESAGLLRLTHDVFFSYDERDGEWWQNQFLEISANEVKTTVQRSGRLSKDW